MNRAMIEPALVTKYNGRIYSLLIMYNGGIYTRWRPPQ